VNDTDTPRDETAASARAASTPSLPTRSWLPAWVLLSSIWGLSFFFIKVSLESFSPVQVAFGRVALGAALLLVLAGVTRTRLPGDRRTWIDVSVVALFFHTLPFTLFSWGETRVSSVLAGIWNAATPLFVLSFGLVIVPWERLTRDKLVGLAIGFGGVLVVLGVWNVGSGGDALGSLACLGATACYGVAVPYTRRRLAPRGLSGISLMSAQLTSGAVQLGIVTVLVTAAPTHVSASSAWSLGLLGALCTGVAYLLSFRIVRDAGSIAASSVTYVVPLVSTTAGVLVLGETMTWNEPVGALVVLSGVGLVQGFVHLPRRRSD
jgi:drug/metabolite transporter (DMT)-like permease